MAQIDRREGRQLFGYDPASYDLARPGHPAQVYELLATRCGLEPGTRVLEIGPGTGQATRPLIERGARLTLVEPNDQLAGHLERTFGDKVEVVRTSLEDATFPPASFNLVVAASSFHWVSEEAGLATIYAALDPDGSVALWWTLFGEDSTSDAFIRATSPLLEGLDSSPTRGAPGRPAHALDVDARSTALRTAGFVDVEHELVRWEASWDASGIRALYGSFSPILRLEEDDRTRLLDEIALIATRDFGGCVHRALTTSVFTAHMPA